MSSAGAPASKTLISDCQNPTNGKYIELTTESLKIKEFPDGTVIYYKCKLGYIRVNGTGEMTCVNGKWTKPDITCRPTDCGPVIPQPHMIFNTSQGTLLGASVYMSCEKGYKIYGSSIKHCSHAGWSGIGICVYVTCSIPSIGNGAHTWTSHRKPEYRQSINFTCNPGYNLHGSKTITCNRRGKYDPEPPKCIAVTCLTPDEVENGRHSWNNVRKPEYRQTIRFTCNTGYNLVGNETIRCTETGVYNSQPPRCVIVTCPKPTRVENGRHSWNNDLEPEYRQTIRFTCNTGYNLVGNETIRCTETGGYDSQPPRCVIVTCPKPTRVENGRHSWNNVRKPEYRQTIRFTCNTGYNLVGNEIIECTETGGYDSQPPRCVIVTCPKPTRVENGRHSWNNVRKPEYQETVYFTCNTGYNLVGNKTIRCTETGGYDSQPPRCVIVTCPKPTRVENGRHSWNNVRKPEYRETVHFTCNTGYTLFGNEIIRCTETGGYDSQPPRCVPDCSKPQHIENTVLSAESLRKSIFPSGTVIKYQCIIGYDQISGTGIIRCVNGKWTKPDIICKKKNCGLPEAKQHMVFDTSQGTLFGAVVTVTCEEGFRLNGSRFKHCLDTGWFGTANCEVVTCPKPTRVENGRHSWNNDLEPEYRQTIRFTCNTGYTLFGNETIRCTVTGVYDSQPPRCVPDCSNPQHVQNTVLSAESLLKSIFPSGTVIKYQCIIGYNKISGTGIIRCVNGKWTKPDIICKLVTCPKPTRVENGRHSWNNDLEPEYRQTIRFTCNTGYTLFGNETIRCTETGGYDSQSPRCVPDCSKPQHVQNTVLSAESLRKRIFPSGTVIKYECMKGCDQIGGTGIIRCVNGKWTKQDIICKRKDCGFPAAQPHMVFDTSQGTLFGAVVTVTCKEGYRLIGSSFKHCRLSGWHGTAICEAVTCSQPIQVENGKHSWNSVREPEYQQTIRFTCNAGYTLFGNETIRCTKTAQFDSEPPRCIADCPKPQHVQNTVLSAESLLKRLFPSGTVIKYQCIIGYNKISGTGIIRCVNGKWTKPDIICKLVTCPKPTRVENGRHSWNNDLEPEYRQIIRFTCNTGYNLVGNETIRCTETGEYDSQPPRCVLVTCPKPTRVENGRHSWNNDLEPEYRQIIRFTCNTGYNLVGNETIRCTETGEYDSQPPRCVLVTCPKPTRVENGRHSWNNVRKPEYRQTIRFTCNTGYNLVGNETVRCTETGGYDSQPPRCVADCPKPQHVQNTVLSAETLRKRIFPSGTVIKYECMKGCDQIGGTGITRCVNGKWTKPDINCKRIDCGVPETKPHMSFETEEGTIIGAMATVICEDGYRVSGASFKQCMDEGWFGIADCISLTCSKPIKVENGKHSWNSDREPKYEQTIHFTCDAGYTLFGNETITCTESAEYDSEPPRCVRNCPTPKSVENMVLTNESLLREDFPDGTKVTYECANGFEKESGSEIITCIDGTWTEPDLICKKIEPPLNLLLIGVAVGCSLALLFCIFWVWRRCSDDSEG
ncbi:sushi, von Willebrand factor type A, EGF and pentraxin domain-containing protein 1-like isoform X2 [Poeciliopsis prolifica]|uniref:sushi, von Willebrand factor type A, EGF and pentraxin domain-containing protein 1-like isoform X2 n=2 Tax=Poeciliopsis prolifica TaxID=188132 RepID=UPI002413A2BA|nr:sushi, von Willebrand factor type A, EGF and pentraxin domain-containing protein 1-like isoform X2 [Poeciliopsis prolifica]